MLNKIIMKIFKIFCKKIKTNENPELDYLDLVLLYRFLSEYCLILESKNVEPNKIKKIKDLKNKINDLL